MYLDPESGPCFLAVKLASLHPSCFESPQALLSLPFCLWSCLQSHQVLREVQIPRTCMITRAPQHHSLAGIPITEAERGSCEKLIPRETGANLKLCVTLCVTLCQSCWHGSRQVMLAPVIQHLWWRWVQRGLAILPKHSQCSILLWQSGNLPNSWPAEELLLRVIWKGSYGCATQAQFFGLWTDIKAISVHLKKDKQEKEENRTWTELVSNELEHEGCWGCNVLLQSS